MACVCEICGIDLDKIANTLSMNNDWERNFLLEYHRMAHIREEANKIIDYFEERIGFLENKVLVNQIEKLKFVLQRK